MFIKNLDSAGRVIGPDVSHRLKSGLVILQPGECVGTHTTADFEEMLVILEGEATVVEEGQEHLVTCGQAAYIAPERLHNVFNRSQGILRYLYIVTPIW